MTPPLPPRFLNWTKAADGRKLPCDASGNVVDAHDPANHRTYEQAAAAGRPVAFDIRAEDGLFFLDLDKCLGIDGWSAEATAIFTSFAGAWGEVSQSGTGLHVIGRCQPAMLANRRNRWGGWKEFYTDGRFVAFGPHGWAPIGGVTIDRDWTDVLLKIIPQREFMGELSLGVDSGYTGPTDDEALIDLMLKARSSAGAMFGQKASLRDLWTGNAGVLRVQWPQGDGYDHSSADAALMTHLAFWTGKDMPRMDRLFRLSGLMRDKYRERTDYRTATVQTAAGLCKRVYDHVAPVVNAASAPEVYLTTSEQLKHFEGCVYIRDVHRVMVPGGKMLRPEQFNATRGGFIFQMEPGGTGPTKKAFEAFTENRAYKFPQVEGVCFRPQEPGGAVLGNTVNTYFDPAVPMIEGDVSRWLKLVTKMLPDTKDRAILLNYMAAVVQYPGVKFQWCPVLQGVEGNGKTLVLGCVAYAVGKTYCYSPRPKHMGGKFNSYVEGKIFILIEEIHMGGRREMLDDLKPVVTNVDLEVEGKGTDKRMIENRANLAMCTNYKTAVIKSTSDRRYSIFYTAQQTIGDLVRDGMSGEYFPDMYRWLRSEGGYAAVAHWLRHFPIDPALNPADACQRAPQTSSTTEAIMQTTGTVEGEVIEATQDNTPGFRGGWISSWAMDKLMRDNRHGISRNRQVEIILSLGYVSWGRSPRVLMQEDGKRPQLFKLPGVPDDFEGFLHTQGYV